MTLSISPTRSGLTTTIVCKRCEHLAAEAERPLDDRTIWIDTNNDVYFQGDSVMALGYFIDRHGGLGQGDVPALRPLRA